MEITTIDSQLSSALGFVGVEESSAVVEKKIDENASVSPLGYYFLNDIFRFVGMEESSRIVEDKVDENASISPLDFGLPSASKKFQANDLVQTMKSSLIGMPKVGSPSTSVAQDNSYDDIQCKFSLP
ncbi:hypothetical protein HAX54_002813 [Datura stramonium]|uniref:Uncharacterized protein n=1 Tax=Datura stramonium TaxID=4076 RepID=A0ABS8T4F2_DATST|nr:hypothetical protein [Datura stramonium]